MNGEECRCNYFYVAEITSEGRRVRLRPRSLEGLHDHFGHDKTMAMGFLLEVVRTLGEIGFIASRDGVAQDELRVEDPVKILTGEQSLPWHRSANAAARLADVMFCCEGHGNPYYCTAP